MATEVWGEGKGRTVNDERGQVTGGDSGTGCTGRGAREGRSALAEG